MATHEINANIKVNADASKAKQELDALATKVIKFNETVDDFKSRGKIDISDYKELHDIYGSLIDKVSGMSSLMSNKDLNSFVRALENIGNNLNTINSNLILPTNISENAILNSTKTSAKDEWTFEDSIKYWNAEIDSYYFMEKVTDEIKAGLREFMLEQQKAHEEEKNRVQEKISLWEEYTNKLKEQSEVQTKVADNNLSKLFGDNYFGEGGTFEKYMNGKSDNTFGFGDNELSKLFGDNYFGENGAFSKYMEEEYGIQSASMNMEEFLSIINEVADASVESFGNLFEGIDLVNGASIKSIASLEAVYKALGPVGIALVALKETLSAIMGQLDDLLSDIGKFSKITAELGIESIDFTLDSISDLINLVKESFNSLQKFSDIGTQIQGNYYALFNYLEDEAGDAIIKYARSLNELYGINPNNYLNNMNGILSVAHNLAKSAEEQVQIVTTLNNTAYDLFALTGGAYGNVDSIKTQLENAINLNVLNSRSAIAKALDLTDDMIKEFKELSSITERYNWILEKTTGIQGLYTKWLQTEAGQVHLLKENYNLLMGNLGNLALGLYAKIAPVLNLLLDLANKVVSSLTGLFGIDLQTNAMINSADKYSNLADSMDEVGESAEKAKRKVSDFDDVIQITNDSSSNSSESLSSFGGGLASNDWTSYIKENKSELKELTDEIKKLLDAGNYIGAGYKINQAIENWLRGLDWNTYKDKAKDFGRNIAEFINGLVLHEETFGEIGNTFSQGINTIFTFIGSLGKSINFENLGVSIGTAWESFWDGLDSDVVGDSIYEWVMGGFETLDSLLETADLSSVTGKIADIIIGFFSNINSEDIVTMTDDVIGIIDEVFNAVQSMIDKFKSDPSLKEKIMSLISNIFTGFKNNAEGWGETANELISGILDFLFEAITTADSSGLSEGIRNFLDGLNLGELLNKYISLKIKTWWIKTKAEWATSLSAFGGILIEALKTIGLLLLEVGLLIATPFLAIGRVILEGLELAWESISDFWSSKAVPFIDSIGSKISQTFSNIENKISEIFNAEKWKKIGRDAFNALFNGIKSVFNNMKEWINKNIIDKLNVGISVPDWVPSVGGKKLSFDIRRLATGGIVTSSTFANIGEAGAEGVFPLTGTQGQAWMNLLADKIASKINSQSSTGGNITIDMSGYQKNFYTRAEMIEFGTQIVEALKTCGVNLQVAY